MAQDRIHCEILEDGTITVTTDGVSGANHLSADELLALIAGMAGGTVERKRRNRLAVNASFSSALHEHTHDGHTHSH